MRKVILCAAQLIIPLIVSATGFAKESATKSFSIQFMKKTIPLGATPEQVTKLLSSKQVSPEDNEKKYSQVYVFKISELERLRLRFGNNKLVSIGFESDSTEGPGKEIAEFERWVEKTYGKGKRLKSKDKSVILTRWDVPGHKIIRDFYYNCESGDSFTSFEITAK
jgi:hypothetical protein